MMQVSGQEGFSAAVTRLELEFALLARRLEANSRERPAPLLRAHYLLLLRLAEGPVAIGALAAELRLDGSTVTRQVNAMQQHGLVTKRANPSDGRGALVERTQKGAVAADTTRQQRLDRIARRFAGWSEADRAELAGWLARVNALFAEDQSSPEP
jgi:DNA-binding MarR family transcriptional regulator